MTGTLRIRRDLIWIQGQPRAWTKIGLNKSENQSTSDQPVRHVEKNPELICVDINLL